MNSLLSDLRFVLRQLRRSQGFACMALLTLGLGVGAVAAVYSVVQSVLLAPLPYVDPGRLVGLAFTFPHERPNAEQTGASADFLRENMQEFSALAVMDDNGPAINLSLDGGHAVQITSLRVSEGYFRTLGAMPALGRTFISDEDRPGGGRAAVLSHNLWAGVFGSDPSIIGRAIRINQEAFTVVGVMPASFAATTETSQGVFGSPDIWEPLQLSPKDPGYDGDNYQMIARLRPGVSMEQVKQHLTALLPAFYQKFPGFKKWIDSGHQVNEFRAWPLQDVLVSQVRRSLLMVMAAVAAVLLLACLNLAGLIQARSMGRTREFALRSALGAKRSQVIRLLACEGALLAIGGGMIGVVVARTATGFLLRAAPIALPAIHGEEHLGLLSLVVLGVVLVVTCIVSLVPALMIVRRGRAVPSLGSQSIGETVSQARISRALIVAQVGLSMVLLGTASQLLGTFLKLSTLSSGVDPKELSVFQVSLKGDPYADTRHTTQFVNTVLEDLRHQPGVDSAAAINGLPMDRGLNIGGYPANNRDLSRVVEFRTVTPGYFRSMGIPILEGRDIEESDRAGADPVILIGAATARRYWPSRSPIGESFRVGGEKNWRIIGVVADVKNHSLLDGEDVVLYAPMTQLSDEFTGMINNWYPTTFAIRVAANVNLAAAAQRAVNDADAQIPIARFSTMQAVIDSTIREPRFFSLLASGFSVFALALTAIGLFGLLSYQVAQRTREIGTRMALGADRASVLRMFLRRGLFLALAGVALGLAAVWLVHPAVQHLLADTGIDVTRGARNVIMNTTLAATLAALAMVASALAASWLPARRAASVEPMQALRTE